MIDKIWVAVYTSCRDCNNPIIAITFIEEPTSDQVQALGPIGACTRSYVYTGPIGGPLEMLE